MAAVPQSTLTWLWNVLTKNHYDPRQTYRDPNRTYHDVARMLAQYPSFGPRTDVYTYENGTPSLLLHLVGTLPVSFRGNSYNIPIDTWIPSAYPLEAPIVYVTPTPDMVVRSGQHVTLEGRVYHHYLAHWHETWDRSSIVELFAVLRDIFSKEPPVKGRPQSRPIQPETPRSAPPPVPPLPPELSTSPRPVETPQHQPAQPALPRPPQLPPKPGQTAPVHSPLSAVHTHGPAVPPLPPKAQKGQIQEWQAPINAAAAQLNRSGSLRVSQQVPVSPNYQREAYTASPVPLQTPAQQMPIPRQYSGPQSPQGYQQKYPPQTAVPYQGNRYQQPPPQSPTQSMTAPKPPKPETPDLLTSPFDVELPSITPTGPPPPVPPNPEKDALLHTLSRTLTENLQGNVSQSKSAVASLQSQSQALSSAMMTLQGELATLNNFKATIESNISILQQSLHRADAVIADAKARTSQTSDQPTTTANGLPPIDEVLVAPTVVGKQLYDLVADERGIQSAIYALQAALVKGVIGADTWSRHTRSLAREAFIKRALIRKIALGMGLDVGEDTFRADS
ncbi:endosomal sorting complex protein TSG101, putative [Talaromyces stipitatus ATCC 10500]|uniref:Endosomal sorting complex protein TSG101, putative n=1 Tax=Talaromyces stipitatus (strain ATCC 10500 / CBS 375.48 / QM 6759 / NRRL 1006) TaxID=441959 RepID=B8M558_TALSN|nr:endosomal sorting complex protein TSG101, putative [Talaromyces stipitatus ATCC 10500]EED19664.1 endosomal sorting complex protein TSG101, putative [Talaromyces stipitatus ATCC 10500]